MFSDEKLGTAMGMSYVFDEGLALFAGLNVIPKRSFLTEYSCRIRTGTATHRSCGHWFDTVKKLCA